MNAPVLAVDDLTFTYPGRTTPAVRGVTFSVAPSEVFGFLGPSGSGKSTTQKVLIGLLRGYAGAVDVLGRPVTDWGQDLYRRIGVSFELPSHYQKLTALENLRLFRELHSGAGRPPETLLERVGLADDANTKVGQFSKGMQMRLNVARALLHAPDVLFLDEPTSGMDPGNARRIKDLIIEERAAGRSVFLTTHDMTVADEVCDRVAFLVDGRDRGHRLPPPAQARARASHSCGSKSAITIMGTSLRTNSQSRHWLTMPTSGALLAAGAAIETVHTQEATLEDIFLQVTGRRLA
jgi:fluoroquinolone transport system ATP-binding protein